MLDALHNTSSTSWPDISSVNKKKRLHTTEFETLKENDYALVLMNCRMPEMDGYETTAAIRNPDSGARCHSIPVIAHTANPLKFVKERCIAAGMDDYLIKPIVLPVML